MTSKKVTFPYLFVALIIFFPLTSCNDFMSKDVKFAVKDDGSSTTDSVDEDADGLGSELEKSLGFNHLDYDSDNDGFGDGLEYVSASGDPLDNAKEPSPLNKSRILSENEVVSDTTDSDTDGLGNLYEQSLGLDGDSADTDNDGYSDMLEVFADSDANDANSKPTRSTPAVDDGVDSGNSGIDSDKDGLSDAVEQLNGTDPQKSDSDGDGYSDALEYLMGSDGSSELSVPDL
ncbi:MAG: hypothetical protein PHC51_10595 [bacterium]|nr:hypothetical protein [bacterium]